MAQDECTLEMWFLSLICDKIIQINKLNSNLIWIISIYVETCALDILSTADANCYWHRRNWNTVCVTTVLRRRVVWFREHSICSERPYRREYESIFICRVVEWDALQHPHIPLIPNNSNWERHDADGMTSVHGTFCSASFFIFLLFMQNRKQSRWGPILCYSIGIHTYVVMAFYNSYYTYGCIMKSSFGKPKVENIVLIVNGYRIYWFNLCISRT